MLLRSGRATDFTGPRHRSDGFVPGCGFDEAAGSLRLKRKSPVDDEVVKVAAGVAFGTATRRAHYIRRRCLSVSALEVTNNGDHSSDEASVAELGVKLFPSLPPDVAADLWVDFVNNATTCINHYNNTHQEASFVYKHAFGNGYILVGEQDGSYYLHLNFIAQDKKGHSQLFFGEMRLRTAPKEEDVTCCCPVSPSDASGKSIRTIEEAKKFQFPTWGTAGMDQENCYACLPRMKHPKGTTYIAGHYADSRQYYMF